MYLKCVLIKKKKKKIRFGTKMEGLFAIYYILAVRGQQILHIGPLKYMHMYSTA